jgi:putative DNA primase/helicase
MIKEYFSKNPTANCGIATGARSGIVVIDPDGVKGVKNWLRLEKLHGANARTLTVATPSGIHLYFRAPKHRVGNSVSKIAEGIDIRGDGGYVVGPGSETLDGVYRFVPGLGANEVKIADAPAWLLKRLLPRSAPPARPVTPVKLPEQSRERALKYADAALKHELERLGKAPLHQRNNTLNLCAFKLGQFLPHGLLNQKSVADHLAQVASRIGLDTHEIRPTIESGLTSGSRQPRRLPFLKDAGRQIPLTDYPKRSGKVIIEQLSKLGENDTDNAQRFAIWYGHKVIYTPGRGFLVFDGKRYRPDTIQQRIELAKETARRIKFEARHLIDKRDRAERMRFARASLSLGSLERMLKLAEPLLTVEDSKLDANPWLLNSGAKINGGEARRA